MLLVEMADPLLGRRRSAVLIATGVGFTLGVGVVLLLSAVLQRSCASVEVGCPAVLAVRRFFFLLRLSWTTHSTLSQRQFPQGAPSTTSQRTFRARQETQARAARRLVILAGWSESADGDARFLLPLFPSDASAAIVVRNCYILQLVRVMMVL